MKINFKDLNWAHLINPVLSLVFPFEDENGSDDEEEKKMNDASTSISQKTNKNIVGAFANTSCVCPPESSKRAAKRQKREVIDKSK
jgi:hypothetical protein